MVTKSFLEAFGNPLPAALATPDSSSQPEHEPCAAAPADATGGLPALTLPSGSPQPAAPPSSAPPAEAPTARAESTPDPPSAPSAPAASPSYELGGELEDDNVIEQPPLPARQ